ncbi:MAG TPA: hypothetical protein DEE98_04160 [Elusimicrobia bacterium]|nr:MAG: hypothetical protein A2278_07170 [Elusimicrobia bacterium RIFOXYA12_FULL_49_49]OGS05983.1 MAG: hypothetical protein A2204_02885 [Elusimicrobia bacterium RIFOXYA1_FULL_47_7]OGS10529.1 MAG: hypothetical protein A2386_05470 [Elusimicrobia bacterium RIFOXYB1_FULL_48_9]OGS16182.1 MAG: hypothetical protein A2251_01015 [Elusimicrobia bacterium RIFOXYA2_FULL_47_53]OGS26619.1 MAG: hypothetical protein A2339_04345 [Elusimicrobia bacterium RIFOXYB12_FULL_50_12]OGS31336.1 MAG: hypothetical protein
MNIFISADNALLALISETLKNGFFDFLMPLVSDSKSWIVPILAACAAMVYFGKKKGLAAFLVCLLTVVVTDAVCGNVLKPLFERARPSGGLSPSFPSNHAANMFAAALSLSYFWTNRFARSAFYFIAVLVGYSRVYTLSHYPSDVLGGALIGSVFALGSVLLYGKLFKEGKK